MLSCLVLALAGATPVAERIELTPSVATELGFKIDAEEDSGEIILTVIYPEIIDSAWKVSGTVVAYFNDRQEFAARTDFEEPSNKRTVFVGFSTLHPLNDAAIDIVYRCISENLHKCTLGIRKHYSVSSARTVMVRQEEN